MACAPTELDMNVNGNTSGQGAWGAASEADCRALEGGDGHAHATDFAWRVGAFSAATAAQRVAASGSLFAPFYITLEFANGLAQGAWHTATGR